ncbi:MAG: hypothetical protein CSA05_01855 [Bacteroidia bacterium]|nr:MAG: hypothetical protein CSA05_01855 [Bacteroidia bacterium]
MKTLKLLLIILSFLFISCEKDNEIKNTQVSLLKQTWLHSYEESFNIYRPIDYQNFTGSRYRQFFTFKDNNICSYSVCAANDAHYGENGKWNLNTDNNILEIRNLKSEVLYKFRIIELDEDLLKVELIDN